MRIHFYFTWGCSLSDWHRSGLLDREVQYFKKLKDAGHDVSIVTYGDNADLAFQSDLPGIEIFPVYLYLKKFRFKFINLFGLVYLLFKKRSFFRTSDIIRTNQVICGPLPIFASFFFRKRLIVRAGYEPVKNFVSHGNLSMKMMRTHILILFYTNALLAYLFARKVICTTEDIKNFISKFYPISAHKIKVLPNYIDTSIFYPNKKKWKRDYVLYVGRLSYEKNLEVLLPALEEANLSLTVVGEGPLKNELIRKANKTGVNIEFLPVQKNSALVAIYQSHSVFVLPSYYEGNPKVLLEAMACGSVPICSQITANNNIVRNNITGFLCKNDFKCYAEHLGMLGNNSQRLLEMSSKCSEFIKANNSIDQVIEKELYIMSSIVKKSI